MAVFLKMMVQEAIDMPTNNNITSWTNRLALRMRERSERSCVGFMVSFV
jgi:hypothetical protein